MCVCVCGMERGERRHGCMVYYCTTSTLCFLTRYAKKQLCYGGALRAVHNMFCWWIKVEEAKYLAQIYAESLTLRTSHPRAKSPFSSHLDGEESERERGRKVMGALRRRGDWEEGIWALSLSNTLHSGEGREDTWEGRGGREGRRLSLHSSKLHWVTHPLLQPWLQATSIKHLHPTGWRKRRTKEEREG